MGLFRYRALQGSSQSDEGLVPFARQRESLADSIARLQPELTALLRLQWQQRRRRTPDVRQLETTECAAICLAIVLRYYRRMEPLSTLRRACGVSRNGSSAAQLVRAAGQFQLDAKGMKRGLNSLEDVPLPAVLFWEFNHFVVLEAITPQGVWVNNPATGRLCLNTEEFDRAYTGVVISMEPSADFQAGGRLRSPATELSHQLRRSRPLHSIALLSSQAAAVALALVLISGSDTPLTTAMIWGLAAAIGLMPAVVAAVARTVGERSGQHVQRRLVEMPEWALQQHPLAELSSRHGGQRRISAVIGDDLLWQIPTVLLLLLWSGLQLSAQPWLALLVLGGTPAVLLLLLLEQALQTPQDNQVVRQERRARIGLQQSLEDPRTMKSLALERRVLQRWSGLQAEASAERLQQQRQARLTGWLPTLLGWGLPILMLSLGGLQLPVLLPALLWWWVLNRLQRQQREWRQIGEPLNALAALDDEPVDALLLDPESPTGELAAESAVAVEVQQLGFGYTPNKQPLLNGVDLAVAPGEWVAITGPSGCGKSTLLNLIAGLLQPDSGQVLLNGQPLLSIPREQRSQAIAMVRQEDALLDISLRDNLTLWDASISDDELHQVCEALGLGPVLQQLPQGLDTVLEPGRFNLSGGQRQLLNLGRVLLQKPQLLLLDEASSALDSSSETQVYELLRQLNCTVVMAAHRSGSVQRADRIITL